MKKLMFATAAMVAGLVFADSAVTSSNVVGYNTTEKIEFDNLMFIGASFANVGGGFLPLSSLACVEGFEDGDQIQTSFVDGSGIVGFTTYEYWDGDGWVDPSSGEVVADEIGFALGKGAWFVSTSAKQITTSGEVKNTNHIHTFEETLTIKTSAFPGEFCPNSANVSWGSLDGDQIQVPFVDENGIVNFTTYEYWDGDGWVDPSSGEVLAADFAITGAGKGFWYVTSDPASVSFTEVSPIAE